MSGKTINTYTAKERNLYLVGLFGQNLIYNIISTGLYFYFQNVICLPAMALGWIFTIARVWDAINDPMMGTIVDRTKSKYGKCRPYLIYFPPIICVITILTFVNGNYAQASTTAQRVLIVGWAAVSYIAWGMLYTVGDIPLWGITSLMTEDEHDRSKILGLARIVGGLGGVGILVVQIAQIIASMFMQKGYDVSKANQYGFILTAIVMTVIASILFEFSGIGARERVEKSEKHYTLAENFKTMASNKPFRQILISGILRSPIQLLMVCAMTLVTYCYANGDIMNAGKDVTVLINIAIIGATAFGGQFIAMALTPGLLKKFEKKTLYNFYSIAGAVPYAMLYIIYVLSNGHIKELGWVIATGLAFLLSGAAMGGINVIQSVMIADCVDYEEYTNGVRTDGVFFSGQSFITKLAAGISSIIASAVYAAVGYSDVNVEKLNIALKEGADFITYDGGSGAGKYAAAMFFLISIPAAIGMLLSAVPTWKYALSDEEHTKILEALIKKRRNNETKTAAAAESENKD